MAADTGVEFQKIAATTTSGNVPATFPGGITELTVCADATVYISADQPCVPANQGMLVPANTPFRFVFKGANVTKIYAGTAASTSNVYLMGVRGR